MSGSALEHLRHEPKHGPLALLAEHTAMGTGASSALKDASENELKTLVKSLPKAPGGHLHLDGVFLGKLTHVDPG